MELVPMDPVDPVTDPTVPDDALPPELDPVLELLSRLVDEVREIADDDARLLALNTIIDGKAARTLQGERQKLDPWGRWMHSTYLDASQGHPEWRESSETRSVVESWDGQPRANLIVSDLGDGRHVPMFDIDLPMRVVPSTNPGKGHLYINKPMPWSDIEKLLDVLVDVKIVHRNYRAHSVERGSTTLRPAFVDKPKGGWDSTLERIEPDWANDPMVPAYAKAVDPDEVSFVDDDEAEHLTDGEVCWCDPDVEAY